MISIDQNDSDLHLTHPVKEVVGKGNRLLWLPSEIHISAFPNYSTFKIVKAR